MKKRLSIIKSIIVPLMAGILCATGLVSCGTDAGGSEYTNWLRIAELTSCSVTFEWDAVPNASGYKIISKDSGTVLTESWGTFATLRNLGYDRTFNIIWEAHDSKSNILESEECTFTTKELTKIETLTASFSKTDKTVNLIWDSIASTTKITSAKLYRAETDGTFSQIAEFSGDTLSTYTYADSSVVYDNTYRYKFITKDSDGNEYESDEVTCDVILGIPDKPENLKVSSSTYSTITFTWDAVIGADGYILYKDNSDYLGTTLSPTEFATSDTNSITVKADVNSYSNYYRVAAKNSKGTGKYTSAVKAAPVSFNSTNITANVESTTQTTATIKIDGLDSAAVAEDDEIIYALYDKFITDITEEVLEENIENKSSTNTLTLSGLEFAEEYYKWYGYIFLKSKNSEGNYSYNLARTSVDRFKTKGFDAPANIKLSNIKRQGLTVSFDPITELYGHDAADIRYKVEIYKENAADDDIYTAYQWTDYGVTDPLTIKDSLLGGTKYVAKVWAQVKNQNVSVYGEKAVSDVFTTVADVTAAELGKAEEAEGWPVGTETRVKMDFLGSYEEYTGESIKYKFQYRIQKGSAWTDIDEANLTYYDNINTYYIGGLNAGNRYTFRVGAYPEDEPGAVVYSEVTEDNVLQCTKVSDKVIACAITFPNAIEDKGIEAGDIIDISKDCVFVNNSDEFVSIKSTSTGYNWGILDFISNSNPNLLIPDGKSIYAFKLSLEDNLDGTIPGRLLLLESTLGNTLKYGDCDLGYCDLHFVKPDENGTFDYTPEYSELNIPTFTNGTTKTAPSSAGIKIPEKYMYNNSLYVGVEARGDNNCFVAFSYYY